MVIYDLNGGTGDFPDEVVDKTVQNTVYSSVPEKEGYIFDCWEIVWTSEESFCLNYKLAPDSIFPDNCHMILKAHYLKIRVNVKNLPSSRAINRAVTPTLQLETDVYPTANDFTETWTPTTPNPATYNMRSVRAGSTSLNITKMWSSSDESIATVNQNGVVTLKKSGIVTITLCTTLHCKNGTVSNYTYWILHIFALSENEDETIFTHDTEIPEEVRGMAIEKMNEYYNDNSDLRNWIDEGNTSIFAFEGLGEGYGGTSAYHTAPYNFLSAMMVVTKGKDIVFTTRRASTLPDLRPTRKDAAINFTTPKEGIYNYKTGYHGNPYYDAKTNSGENTTDGYLALVPNLEYNDSWVGTYKDDDIGFYCKSCFGINLHATGYTPISDSDDIKDLKKAHSRGCQTVSITEYIEFGKKVGFIKEDFSGTPEPSGYSGSLNTMLAPIHAKHNYIEVKYILDRSEDKKNIDFVSTGTFYPIAHTCNNLCFS